MKTSEIKQIIAKDPNAVFIVKARNRTCYATIKEVVEREVPVYSDWSGKQISTRTSVHFNVLGSYYRHGLKASDGYREERVPAYGLENIPWIKPRDIQRQYDFGTGETLEQWVANEDRQVKANWQASIQEENMKDGRVMALVRHLSSPTVSDKEWDRLSGELSRLSLETLQLISEHIVKLTV